VSTPLAPSEFFPAGIREISSRIVPLSTGVRVRVVESGPADGVPLVMLHGWGASVYTFRHAFSMLPPIGVRAIGVDLHGYGLSDRPRQRGAYSLASYMADLVSLLDVLELPRAAFLAQSMGGGLTLRFALAHPGRVRGLALINPSGLVPIPGVAAMRFAPRGAVEAVGERLVPRWLVRFVLRYIAFGDASRLAERDVDEYWSAARLPGYVRAIRGAISEFDWRALSAAEAQALAAPAMVILGQQDRLIRGASEAAARLRGSEVHLLPGGHCVHEERPEVVYPLVAEFLTKLR
jgi:pimeloyl-ACP methyl ester carboxylesterase